MTIEDLIKKTASEVRNSNELMTLYVKSFEDNFGYKPQCAGCTFSNDWGVFVKKVKSLNINLKEKIMSKSFEIRDTSEIYTYQKKGESKKRCYGYNMTEEFALAYLKHGTAEEIEGRKKEFKVLPKDETEKEVLPKAKAEKK